MTDIATAIERMGGPSKAAAILGVSAQAVCFWRDGQRKLPAEHCALIERASGILRQHLRPDDWARIWPELTAPACACRAWEMSPEEPIPPAPSAPSAPAPEPGRAQGAASAGAMLLGGRREDDHESSDFGALDLNGPTLVATIDAFGRLTGEGVSDDGAGDAG